MCGEGAKGREGGRVHSLSCMVVVGYRPSQGIMTYCCVVRPGDDGRRGGATAMAGGRESEHGGYLAN